MASPRAFVKLPTGFAFDIPDLLMLQAWAEFHELRMTIELDVCDDDGEYEEKLGLYQQSSAFCRWMLWRSCEGIKVQPAMGRALLFDTTADALEMLISAPG